MNTLFMDRDGVVNEQIIGGYVENLEQFELKDHFLEAMKILRSRFRHVVLITNQQGIGKGLCTQAQVDAIHSSLQMQLLAQRTPFDAIYCCPHLASDGCCCRKPKPGMAFQARQDFPDIVLEDSIMVGDSLSDMQFARNAGVVPVHVGAMRHPEFEEILQVTHHHFDDLLDFARHLDLFEKER